MNFRECIIFTIMFLYRLDAFGKRTCPRFWLFCFRVHRKNRSNAFGKLSPANTPSQIIVAQKHTLHRAFCNVPQKWQNATQLFFCQFVGKAFFPFRHRVEDCKTVRLLRSFATNFIAIINCQTPTAIKNTAKQLRKILSSVLPAKNAPNVAKTVAGKTIQPNPSVLSNLFLA